MLVYIDVIITYPTQGQKESEYFAFTSSSKNGQEKKYHCHIFRGENKQTVHVTINSNAHNFI